MRLQKPVAIVLAALVTVLLCEAAAWLVLWVQDGERFSYARFRRDRQQVLASAAGSPVSGIGPLGAIRGEAIHPYLGFVLDPTRQPGVSRFGFPGRDTPLGEAGDGALVVAVTGGSFAQGLVRDGAEALTSEIRSVPELAEARIEIRNLALGGFKQPQQLLTVLWSLLLGAHFEAVVNIDGFNEVVLAPAEFGSRVHPLYPRGWAARVGNLVEPDVLRLIAEASDVEDRARRWAAGFERWPLRTSVVANAVWRTVHRGLVARRLTIASELADRVRAREQELGYAATGPAAEPGSEGELLRVLAEAWAGASYQLHLVCEGYGIPYVHVLQPNQYVPGSKPLSRAERRVAIRQDQPYRSGVVDGYPLLVAEGARLRERGVDFRDCTMIFRDEPEALWIDDCCHLSPEGYRRVAAVVGRAIAARLAGRPQRGGAEPPPGG